MKYPFVIGFTFAFLLLQLNNSWSQELICSAGDVFSNSSVQMEWSLGEPAIDTYSGETLLLTQGFHQPDTKMIRDENITISVHPNPFDMFLVIEIQELESENMYCLMIDVSGKIVRIVHNLKEYNEIVTSEMSDGIYLLRLFDSKSHLMKTVKIIKLFQI